MEVSFFEDKTSTPVVCDITGALTPTPDIIQRIKDYRAKLRTLTPDEKKSIKTALPGFTPGCLCGTSRKDIIARSGLICVDIDHLPTDRLQVVKEQLKQWKYTYAVWLSVSGDGLAVLIKIPTEGEFVGYFHSLEKYFRDELSVTIDKKCKDINRLRFVSHDEDLYINEDSKVWTESFIPEKKRTEYVCNSDSLIQNSVKDIPISAYLEKCGYVPTKENEADAYYKSPLREGKKLNSFHVDKIKNRWFDFGLSQGGSIIDLVMALYGLTATEAIQRLKEETITPQSSVMTTRKKFLPFTPCGYLHRKQLQYIESRGITDRALYQDLFETVRRENFYGLGWTDINRRWHYRSGDIKLSESGASYTVIGNDSRNVIIFEGVFSALSFLTIYPAYKSWDVVVLNSVINTDKAINALKEYDRIVCLCDNDEAGMQASLKIKAEIAQAEIYNQLCNPYNDWNDYLMAKKQAG